jgi:hypothetical protein
MDRRLLHLTLSEPHTFLPVFMVAESRVLGFGHGERAMGDRVLVLRCIKKQCGDLDNASGKGRQPTLCRTS